jgi:hypothetical protein
VGRDACECRLLLIVFLVEVPPGIDFFWYEELSSSGFYPRKSEASLGRSNEQNMLLMTGF